jgi:hypothetical protein
MKEGNRMPVNPDEMAEALGATRSFPVSARPTVPFGILQLQAELADRLRAPSGAKAGRPSDPECTIRRLVGFRPETWQALAEIAAQASTPRRRVSPGQVAALLIEDGIARLRASSSRPDRDTLPEASSGQPDA